MLGVAATAAGAGPARVLRRRRPAAAAVAGAAATVSGAACCCAAVSSCCSPRTAAAAAEAEAPVAEERGKKAMMKRWMQRRGVSLADVPRVITTFYVAKNVVRTLAAHPATCLPATHSPCLLAAVAVAPAACCLAPTACPLTARRRSPPHLRTTAVRRWARALHQGPAAASLLPERPTAASQARVHRALPKVLQHHAREGHRRCRAPRGVAVIPPHPGGAGQHAQELCARPRGEHSALQAVVSNPRRFAE